MILTLLAFIAVLGIIIFVHELGHFLAAKLAGIRVETFSLGFPPKLFSKKIGDTEYVLAWIPLGGYVKMAGMIDESLEDKPLTGEPWEFMSKSFLQKVFVISAGVIMNFLLGILIYFTLTWAIGIAQVKDPVVGYVVKDYPAALAGIEVGDRILKINGDSIATWQQLTEIIHPRAGDTLEIIWQRGDQSFTDRLVPQGREVSRGDSTYFVGAIGINPQPRFEPVGLVRSFWHGFEITGFIIAQSLTAVKMLVFGQASLNDVAGPIGIAQLSGETIRSGWADYISFIAQISVSIGLLNILPFPVLDGGHLIFISLEAILRRPISTKVKLTVQKIGLALLLAFFLLVSYHDILRIVLGR